MIKKKHLTTKFTALLLAGALAALPVLSGCSTGLSKKAQEYKELGISLLEAGDYEGALESFQKALDESVGTIGAEELDLCYYKALALFLSGDTDGAIEQYTALLDLDSENWEVYYLRGVVYLASGETASAEIDFANAASYDSGDLKLYVNIYAQLAEAGEAAAGEEYLSYILAVSPADAEEYYLVGEACWYAEEYDLAEENLLAAEEAGYEEALLLLGQVYTACGETDAAAAAFEEYITLYPENAQLLINLGQEAMESGDYEFAVALFTAALLAEDDTLEATIRKNLIAAYEYAGDFDSAYEQAQLFLEIAEDEDVKRELEFLATRISSFTYTVETEEDEEDSEEDEETDSGETSEDTTEETSSSDSSSSSGSSSSGSSSSGSSSSGTSSDSDPSDSDTSESDSSDSDRADSDSSDTDSTQSSSDTEDSDTSESADNTESNETS